MATKVNSKQKLSFEEAKKLSKKINARFDSIKKAQIFVNKLYSDTEKMMKGEKIDPSLESLTSSKELFSKLNFIPLNEFERLLFAELKSGNVGNIPPNMIDPKTQNLYDSLKKISDLEKHFLKLKQKSLNGGASDTGSEDDDAVGDEFEDADPVPEDSGRSSDRDEPRSGPRPRPIAQEGEQNQISLLQEGVITTRPDGNATYRNRLRPAVLTGFNALQMTWNICSLMMCLAVLVFVARGAGPVLAIIYDFFARSIEELGTPRDEATPLGMPPSCIAVNDNTTRVPTLEEARNSSNWNLEPRGTSLMAHRMGHAHLVRDQPSLREAQALIDMGLEEPRGLYDETIMNYCYFENPDAGVRDMMSGIGLWIADLLSIPIQGVAAVLTGTVATFASTAGLAFTLYKVRNFLGILNIMIRQCFDTLWVGAILSGGISRQVAIMGESAGGATDTVETSERLANEYHRTIAAAQQMTTQNMAGQQALANAQQRIANQSVQYAINTAARVGTGAINAAQGLSGNPSGVAQAMLGNSTAPNSTAPNTDAQTQQLQDQITQLQLLLLHQQQQPPPGVPTRSQPPMPGMMQPQQPQMGPQQDLLAQLLSQQQPPPGMMQQQPQMGPQQDLLAQLLSQQQQQPGMMQPQQPQMGPQQDLLAQLLSQQQQQPQMGSPAPTPDAADPASVPVNKAPTVDDARGPKLQEYKRELEGMRREEVCEVAEGLNILTRGCQVEITTQSIIDKIMKHLEDEKNDLSGGSTRRRRTNRKRTNRKRTNRKRTNRKRTNRKRTNRKRTNIKRTNRKRTNRKRTNKRRTNRKM